MTFVFPWALLALPVLPALWWLLRVTPPAPRREIFPAARLLMRLPATAETPSRTPWWLLLLRMLAAGLVIVGLSGPVLEAGGVLPGTGQLLLVIDDGWAAAVDWPQRRAEAAAVLDRADREGRAVALLATAPPETAATLAATPAIPAAELRPLLAALGPKPWPVDRAAAAAALRRRAGQGGVVYLADGTTGGAGWDDFAAALAAAGPVEVRRDPEALPRLLLPPRSEADRLVARVAQVPQANPTEATVLAQSGDGRTLARVPARFPPLAAEAEAPILLPPELRNRLGRLVLEGQSTAGAVLLLDERWRRRPVGLLADDAGAATAPLTGSLYYLRRALAPTAELRQGDLTRLLGRELSVLILADIPVADGPDSEVLARWVDRGGLLLRFAGPRLAEHPDALLPVRLLAGDRQLGGAMSWSEPAGLAAFPAASPFAGLPVPDEVKVTRQVLAEPGAQLAEATWARLADGTPLVTEAPRGAGRIVLFHVTANADWSNLPLSGLFVDMLRRLVAVSAGVAAAAGDEKADQPPLAPAETLDGFGQLGAPPPAAAALPADEFAAALASPRHPPGLYGPENGRRALNLSNRMAAPGAAPPIPGASVVPFGGAAAEQALAPGLVAVALALLAIDLLLSLRLRGLLRAAVLAFLIAATPVRAQEPSPALATRLAYVVTGNAQADQVARSGLAGLSDYVNRRTAANLADPAAVVPGHDDLSFYPLLYWPIVAEAAAPPAAAVTALNAFMADGGIILIDTAGGGSGEGFNPGAEAALRRAVRGLEVPPLVPLTTAHVLARAFYLLQDFPGRFTGDTVWVQRDQDRGNDSVSPVIIGSHGWAAAWAIDESGRPIYAVIPGGVRQRTLAFRFGVNLVMYALTGNYKGDQVHVPALLERLGQ